MEYNEFKCNGQNVVDSKAKICCDIRRDKCEYHYLIEKHHFKVNLCLKECLEDKEN